MIGWTTKELQEEGQSIIDIYDVNLSKLQDALSKVFCETILNQSKPDYPNIAISTSVDIMNIYQMNYLDEIKGCFVLDKEQMLDPLKGITSVLFDPKITYHPDTKLHDFLEEEQEVDNRTHA